MVIWDRTESLLWVLGSIILNQVEHHWWVTAVNSPIRPPPKTLTPGLFLLTHSSLYFASSGISVKSIEPTVFCLTGLWQAHWLIHFDGTTSSFGLSFLDFQTKLGEIDLNCWPLGPQPCFHHTEGLLPVFEELQFWRSKKQKKLVVILRDCGDAFETELVLTMLLKLPIHSSLACHLQNTLLCVHVCLHTAPSSVFCPCYLT